MTDILVKVALPSVTGLPEDDAVIDLVYTSPTAVGSIVWDDLGVNISSFFNAASVTTFDVATYVSNDVSRAALACRASFYDLSGHLDGSPVGSPVATYDFTLDDPLVGSVALPAEVAAVLSFSADTTNIPERQTNPSPPPAFIRPAARRRGRVFIGPLNNATLSGDNPSRSRPSNNLLDTIRDSAAQSLAAGALSETDAFVWSVWSRVDEVLRPVVEVSTDNAWDTVRSRGIAPTTREVTPV